MYIAESIDAMNFNAMAKVRQTVLYKTGWC